MSKHSPTKLSSSNSGSSSRDAPPKADHRGLFNIKEYTDMALSLIPEQTTSSFARLKLRFPQKKRDKSPEALNKQSSSSNLTTTCVPEQALCRDRVPDMSEIVVVDESIDTANNNTLLNIPFRAVRSRNNTFSTVGSGSGYPDVIQRVPTSEENWVTPSGTPNLNQGSTFGSSYLFTNVTSDKHLLKDAGVAFLKEKESKMNADPLEKLPSETIHQILSYLDVYTLLTCSLVSKLWKETIDLNSVWRNEFNSKRYWKTTDNVPASISWKELYKARHTLEKRWNKGLVKATTLMGHSDRVYCVYFDNDQIVTGSSDRTINVWDYQTGALRKSLGRWKVDSMTQQNETPAAAIFSDDMPLEINGPSMRPQASDASFASVSTETSLVSNGSGSSSNASRKHMTVRSNNIYHKGSVLCIAFDKKVMITGSSDCTCIVWELPRMKPVKQFYRHKSGVLEVSMTTKYITTCSKDSTITVWENNHPTYSKIATLVGHKGPVNSLQVKGDLVVSAGGDSLVKLWSIAEKRCLKDFRGHTRGLACVSFSEDGDRIISGGNDNTIRIWDVATGQCLNILSGHKSLVRSLCVQSNRIISGSYDQTIKIWDIDTGRLIADLDGYHGSWIFSVKSDCHRIISTSMGIKPVILDFADGIDPGYLKYLLA